ncbi:TPA: DEAD/DEAH box helicase [Vibrio parahaemolyticus]|nr:DEAD/DEAH box helicase [Vibrio parahaemolyticus]
MKNELRNYQSEAVESVLSFLSKKRGNPLVVAPTGAGKTLIIREVINRLLQKTNKRIVILTPRVRLLQQIAEEVSGGLLAGSLGHRDISSDVIISTTQSFIKHEVEDVGYIIFDECHLLSFDETEESEIRNRLVTSFPNVPIIGLTATPFRRNTLLSDQDAWTEVYRITLSKLLDQGYLSPIRPIRTDSVLSASGMETMSEELEKITRANIQTSKKLLIDNKRRKALVFAKSIEHAEFIAQYLKSLNEEALVVHSRLNQREIDKRCEQFEQKDKRQWMINVGLLTVGYDNPSIDALVYLRSIQSITLWIQSVGRGMRIHEKKKDCLLIDFGKHVSRFGPLDQVLTGSGGERDSKQHNTLERYCGACGSENHVSARSCKFCGGELPIRLNLSDASEGLDILNGSYDIDIVTNIKHDERNGQKILFVNRTKEPIFIDGLLVSKQPQIGDSVMIRKTGQISMCVRIVS